jgi:hypothetical protein
MTGLQELRDGGIGRSSEPGLHLSDSGSLCLSTLHEGAQFGVGGGCGWVGRGGRVFTVKRWQEEGGLFRGLGSFLGTITFL